MRKKLSHFIPPWLERVPRYFVTINCEKRGQNQLCQPEIAQGILESARFQHERLAWQVVVFLLMPDHLHAIIGFGQQTSMANSIKSWKGYQAKKFQIHWQSGFFDHRLRDRWAFEEKLSYVLNNPVRKGLCEKSGDWPHVFRPMDRPIEW